MAGTAFLFCRSAVSAICSSPLKGKFALEQAFWWSLLAGCAPFFKVLIDASHAKLCMQVNPTEYPKNCARGCYTPYCEVAVHSLLFCWGLGGVLFLRFKQTCFWMWTLGLSSMSLLLFFTFWAYNLIGAVVLFGAVFLVCMVLWTRFISEKKLHNVVQKFDSVQVWSKKASHFQSLDSLSTSIRLAFSTSQRQSRASFTFLDCLQAKFHEGCKYRFFCY